nr:GNAT family N-acetyltransferase [Kribbella sandramycini]
MPAEVLPWQGGSVPIDPAAYTIAQRDGRHVGLIRLATHTRQPRIGLIAVRSGERRTGIARALLGHALTELHHSGIETVVAEVNENNPAACALFEGLGARRTGGNLELVHGEA